MGCCEVVDHGVLDIFARYTTPVAIEYEGDAISGSFQSYEEGL